MSTTFLPAREEGALAPVAPRRLLAVGALGLVAAAVFWSPLLLGGGLQGHDWSTHHFHYFDWVAQSFRQYATFPLFMADAWVTPNFLANAESPSLGPLAWALLFVPAGAYVKLLFVVFCGLGLAGGWLLARDLGAAAPIAALVSGAYAFGGFFVSHLSVGHHWAMGAWLLPLLVWLARRAVLGSDVALFAAAALNAFTILGGQHQPFIWQNLVFGALALLWCARVRAAYPLLRIGAMIVCSAALGAVKIVPLWLEFAEYAPAARIAGFPPLALLASLLSRGQLPDRIDAAIAYDFGAGWWEYAFYLGPVALVAVVVGAVAARGVWPLLAIGVFFLLASIEPGPWLLFQDLPVWRTQRCPSRFAVLALFAFLFAAATGLERLRVLAARRRPALVGSVLWVIAFVAIGDLWLESRAWQHSATQGGEISRTHRPQPERLVADGASAELAGFSPNRLVYAIEADAPARIVLPIRFGRRQAEWDVVGAEIERSDIWLAARVGPATREIVLAYEPPGMKVGIAVSAFAWLAAFAVGITRFRRGAA